MKNSKGKELTKYAFISHTESYMKQLLDDPSKANIDDFLKSFGLTNETLLKMLLKRKVKDNPESAVLCRKETIRNGKMNNGIREKDTFVIKYKIPRKNYSEKMSELYKDFIDQNLNEEGEGATNCSSSGQFITPLAAPIKRKTQIYLSEEQMSALTKMMESKEFNPVVGGKANNGNKTESEKFYKETKKLVSEPKKSPEYKKADLDVNKTLMDFLPEDLPENFKERVKAQMQGYTSEAEKNNKIEKTGDFSGNEKIYKALDDSNKKMVDNEKKFKQSGLQAKEWPDSVFEKKKRMFENISTIKFKKTEFLSEGHMFSKIPDEMKVEGKKFRMKDCLDNEYIVEWKYNSPKIIDHENPNGAKDAMERMKSLFEYRYDTGLTNKEKITESNSVYTVLEKVREINKKAKE